MFLKINFLSKLVKELYFHYNIVFSYLNQP
jgi:hypothetical protein